MNWRKGVWALAGGALGFTILLAADGVVIITALQSMYFFSSPSLSGGQTMIICLVAPMMIVAGAALTARSLGATWQRSLAAGIVALATVVGFMYAGRGNYSPFNAYETLIFVGAAVVTVWVATFNKSTITARNLTVTLGLSAVCILAVFVAAGHGLVVAALTWLILPTAAGLAQTRSST